MKRKSPIDLCLVQDSEDEQEQITSRHPLKKRKVSIDLLKQGELRESKNMSPPPSPNVTNMPRPCTPSPMNSPKSSRKEMVVFPHKTLSNGVAIVPPPSPPQLKQQKPVVSILRKPSSSSSKLAKYKHRLELVEGERDLSIASNYEMLLYSHMIMPQHVPSRVPCFQCRMCPPSPQSTFYCHSVQNLVELIPYVEQHLCTCTHAPSWLNRELVRTKYTHFAEVDPRKPYLYLIWKRLLAHAIFSTGTPNTCRVRFSNHHQEIIIPARQQQQQHHYHHKRRQHKQQRHHHQQQQQRVAVPSSLMPMHKTTTTVSTSSSSSH